MECRFQIGDMDIQRDAAIKYPPVAYRLPAETPMSLSSRWFHVKKACPQPNQNAAEPPDMSRLQGTSHTMHDNWKEIKAGGSEIRSGLSG